MSKHIKGTVHCCRLVNDPIWTPPYTKNGGRIVDSRANFYVAVNDKEKATYLNLTVWGGAADSLVQYLRMGSLVSFDYLLDKTRGLQFDPQGKAVFFTSNGKSRDIEDKEVPAGVQFHNHVEYTNFRVDEWHFAVQDSAGRLAEDTAEAAKKGISLEDYQKARKAKVNLPWNGGSAKYGFAKVSLPKEGTVIPHKRKNKTTGEVLEGGQPQTVLIVEDTAQVATPTAPVQNVGTYADFISKGWTPELMHAHGWGHLVPKREVPPIPAMATPMQNYPAPVNYGIAGV